jgi:hypothetical protein
MHAVFDQRVLYLKRVAWRVVAGQFDFDILDHQDRVLATVREPKQHLWKSLFRNVIGAEYSAKHFMHADGVDGEPLFAIDKHNELRGDSASIQLPNVGEIGRLNMVSRNPVKAHFQIADDQNQLIADIPIIPLGISTSIWNLRVLDPQGVEIAEILNTDPQTGQAIPGLYDRVMLKINYQLPEKVRILLVAAFVAIEWFDEERFAK